MASVENVSAIIGATTAGDTKSTTAGFAAPALHARTVEVYKTLLQKGLLVRSDKEKDEIDRIESLISNVFTACDQAGIKERNALGLKEFSAILKHEALGWNPKDNRYKIDDLTIEKFFRILLVQKKEQTITFEELMIAVNWMGPNKELPNIPPLKVAVHFIFYAAAYKYKDKDLTTNQANFRLHWKGFIDRRQSETMLVAQKTLFRMAEGRFDTNETGSVAYFRGIVFSKYEELVKGPEEPKGQEEDSYLHTFKLNYDANKQELIEVEPEVRQKYRRRGKPIPNDKKPSSISGVLIESKGIKPDDLGN